MDEKLPQDGAEGRDDDTKQFESAPININAEIETFIKQNAGLAEGIARALAPSGPDVLLITETSNGER